MCVNIKFKIVSHNRRIWQLAEQQVEATLDLIHWLEILSTSLRST